MLHPLTRSERSAMQKLVREMCANYDKIYDCCALLDDYGCYQLTRRFADDGMCRYFARAVLPLHPALQAAFSPKDSRRCSVCGGKYIPTGRSQKYCVSCKENTQKSAAAKRAKKYRRNSRANVMLLD